MTTLKDIKRALEQATARYHEIANTAPAPECQALHLEIKRLRAALSAAITEGCNPCPFCGKLPHGMEQPNGKRGIEYEIGCIPCPPFKHDDGTMRNVAVRGGLLPQHAVDAWNAGPDHFQKAKEQ
jgi:hypothetical protein